jgi:hypothetical protein
MRVGLFVYSSQLKWKLDSKLPNWIDWVRIEGLVGLILFLDAFELRCRDLEI